MTQRATVPVIAAEKDFQAYVVQVAKLNRWFVYHTHDSRRSEAGFPDLCLVRGKRLIFAELKKSSRSRVSPAQLAWLEALAETGAETYIWRGDTDRDEVIRILGRRAT